MTERDKLAAELASAQEALQLLKADRRETRFTVLSALDQMTSACLTVMRSVDRRSRLDTESITRLHAAFVQAADRVNLLSENIESMEQSVAAMQEEIRR